MVFFLFQTEGVECTDSWYSEHHVSEETVAKVGQITGKKHAVEMIK